LCDAGYVEYSFDGANWNKLGAFGLGTNWYDSTFDVWNREGFTRWHVASIPIPELGTGQTTHFRFVLAADPGVTFEGLAIDDVHVYDLVNPIAPANGTMVASNSLSNNQWTDYLLNNQLLASIQPVNQSISSATATLYAHDTLSNPHGTQYTMPRSYLVQSPQSPTAPTGVRLYLLDSDVVNVLHDTLCQSCTPLLEAYSLGITQYSNPANKTSENGTLVDDNGGVITYYPHNDLKWVPYDKGYYAELNVNPLSELWFNNGGPTGNFPATADYLNFIAYRNGTNVATYWYSLIDTAVSAYTLQRSHNDSNYISVKDFPAKHVTPGEYTYVDSVNFNTDTVLYYRLRWTMEGKDGYNYSPVRKIDNTDSGANLVSLGAKMISHENVLVSWTSYVDAIANYYKVERAVGEGAYQNINNTNALHQYSQSYSFTDQVTFPIPTGTPVHYRLTAILDDGAEIETPIRDVIWVNENSVLNIYPNPTVDGIITIAWNADPGTAMSVHIFDELGRSMYGSSAVATQWNNTTTLQTFRGANGVYAVRIDIGGRRYSAMMVYE
jgi:type IX secretion system substrate protein